jgi:hypothetical protein
MLSMPEQVGLAEQVRQQLGVAAGIYAPAPLRDPQDSGTATVGAFSFVLFAADPRRAGVSTKRREAEARLRVGRPWEAYGISRATWYRRRKIIGSH